MNNKTAINSRKIVKLTSTLFLGLLLNGCVQTSSVLLDDTFSYPPTTSVKILAQVPDQPFKKIAILEASGPANTAMTDLLKSMKKKAMAVGADAIIPTESAGRQVPQSLMYNPWLGGYQNVGGYTLPILRGVAIKFTK